MKSLRNILPVLCVVNLLLFMMLAQHWWLGGLVGLLIGGAFYLTCLPAPEAGQAAAVPLLAAPATNQVAAAAPAQAEPVADAPSQLSGLLQRVLPLWQGHVQLARAQTKSAIDNLTARFVGIHERLGGALDLSQSGKNADVLKVIQNAAEQLGGIASALESVLASRQALLAKLDTVAGANDDIRRLAHENEQLAGRTGVTDLLSDELSWQELAERSAENSRQIAARAKGVRQQIMAAVGGAGEASAVAGGIIENSREVIDQVVADFRESALKLSATVEQLEGENREVDREVCDILVNLQFQDRISQILDHVQRDIVRLHEAAGGPGLPSPEQWLAELEKTYTTQEQRQVHAGQQAQNSLQSQVDFF
ncbi:chemotaxis protein [Herbaspirillum robiniae]|uniref:Chemotaxis protein n=1 Tax=Herbaspirillum robiniae TaxID=2014887 RepID=A0ABX2LRJ9_9BURK|nr:chemotaxis protein [Herbaspirillum robiniae]NUU00398.1 chemotaxis protein [Herbaspirillum robiniae]